MGTPPACCCPCLLLPACLLLLVLPLVAGSASSGPAGENSPYDHCRKGHADYRNTERAVAAVGVTDVAKNDGAKGADDEACSKGMHGGLWATRACFYLQLSGQHLLARL